MTRRANPDAIEKTPDYNKQLPHTRIKKELHLTPSVPSMSPLERSTGD